MIKRPTDNNKEDENNNGELGSKSIPVDSKEDEIQNVDIDFQTEDLASEYVKKETKQSSDSKSSIDPNTPVDKLQDDIKSYEQNKSGKLEYKDFVRFAEFIITLIDTTVSTALNWWAKDTSINAYSLPSQNRKLLIEQLALILAKYQSKFSIEFMFLMGLFVLYAPAAISANKRKKEIAISKRRIDRQERQVEKKPNESHYRHNPDKYNPEQDVKEPEKEKEVKVEPEEKEIKVPLKRKRGTQPKAY